VARCEIFGDVNGLTMVDSWCRVGECGWCQWLPGVGSLAMGILNLDDLQNRRTTDHEHETDNRVRPKVMRHAARSGIQFGRDKGLMDGIDGWDGLAGEALAIGTGWLSGGWRRWWVCACSRQTLSVLPADQQPGVDWELHHPRNQFSPRSLPSRPLDFLYVHCSAVDSRWLGQEHTVVQVVCPLETVVAVHSGCGLMNAEINWE
jgi:hypothetical protein